MKFRPIPTFRSDHGTVVQFFPVKDVPGYTHRVVIDGVAVRSWLSAGFRPNASAATFFAAKHANKVSE